MLKLTFAQNTRFVKCNEKGQIFASLEISPDQSTQFIQKTSHVALAIDCSGSMAGEKLEDAKISAIEAVKSLTENDLVSIVSFGTDVNVELSARSATDPSVVDRIDTLNIMGLTDLHGGISEAFHLLQRTRTPDTTNKLMLFSDGDASTGITEDSAIVELVKEIRRDSMTLDIFGIGDDYNEDLVMQMAEYGGGKWEHVQDTTNLQTTVIAQMTEMRNTIISNPQLEINLMPGAVIKNANITQPTSEEINLEQYQKGNQTISFGIKDIIKDQSQKIAMQVSVPAIQGKQSLMTAVIMEGNKEVENATMEIDCSDDPEILKESNADPRLFFFSVKATVLKTKGLAGDPEATKMADTIFKNLNEDLAKTIMGDNARATVIKAEEVAGKLKPGMDAAEKKTVLHESTKIGQVGADSAPDPVDQVGIDLRGKIVCPHCQAAIKPGKKFCGKCGKPINKKEEL